jgi:hypothetical protein
VQVRLVPEEQHDAGAIRGPRERLGLGVGAPNDNHSKAIIRIALAFLPFLFDITFIYVLFVDVARTQ